MSVTGSCEHTLAQLIRTLVKLKQYPEPCDPADMPIKCWNEQNTIVSCYKFCNCFRFYVKLFASYPKVKEFVILVYKNLKNTCCFSKLFAFDLLLTTFSAMPRWRLVNSRSFCGKGVGWRVVLSGYASKTPPLAGITSRVFIQNKKNLFTLVKRPLSEK